jgi:hypothetical protein
MTHNDLQMLYTLETPEYLKGELDGDSKTSCSANIRHMVLQI